MEGEPEITSDYGAASNLTSHAVSLNYADSWLHVSCRDPLLSNLVIEHAVSQGLHGLSIDFIFSSLLHQLHSLENLLHAVNYMFINALELDLAMPTLTAASYEGYIIVTDGARGSRIIKKGKVVAQAAAKHVDNVVDQTGSGDAFVGAFLGMMHQSAELSAKLESANGVARLKLTGCGVQALLAQIERSQAS
jgi:sugar/nucleoside kinase (ribokinase family)